MCYYGHEIMVMKSKGLKARDRSEAYGTAFSREIPAGEFKARCLALMDEVQESGREYVITKRGVPVAKLVAVHLEQRTLFGSMKGTVTVLGDIVSPLDESWEALDAIDDER